MKIVIILLALSLFSVCAQADDFLFINSLSDFDETRTEDRDLYFKLKEHNHCQKTLKANLEALLDPAFLEKLVHPNDRTNQTRETMSFNVVINTHWTRDDNQGIQIAGESVRPTTLAITIVPSIKGQRTSGSKSLHIPLPTHGLCALDNIQQQMVDAPFIIDEIRKNENERLQQFFGTEAQS